MREVRALLACRPYLVPWSPIVRVHRAVGFEECAYELMVDLELFEE